MLELPKLDYKNNALLPVMSEQTLDLHHCKHHQTYITNLNNLIKDTELEKLSLEEIIKKTSNDKNKSGIFNNASQHWNHNLFWKCMKPNGGGKMPSKLEAKINKDFDSMIEGLEMVNKMTHEVFEKFGVSRLNTVGEVFDPNIHQAVGVVQSDSVPENHIVEECLGGYLLHDRIIRPAMVRVSGKS